MLLRIAHQTDLSYTLPISESVMELRMAPRQEQDQHRLSFTLAIGPSTSVTSYFDWLGNTVHAFTVNSFHQQIRIIATSVVETDRARIDPEQLPDPWPLAGTGEYSMLDYQHFGGPVVDSSQLRELVASVNPEAGMSLGVLTMRLLRLIGEKFVYEKGITTAASPITETLDHRRGVCQDFAHLMIGMARALGIPARYVSGFIHPEAERYRGYTQTHAWCEIYFPATGWIGFDPANQCVVGSNFVKVAVGRDFRDVPPNKGIYRGSAKETINVAVTSDELKTVPAELAAERMQSLNIPLYPPGASPHREQVNQQQEQQQQWGGVLNDAM
jgi:transglutaminase-like putative cysteine protease